MVVHPEASRDESGTAKAARLNIMPQNDGR